MKWAILGTFITRRGQFVMSSWIICNQFLEKCNVHGLFDMPKSAKAW